MYINILYHIHIMIISIVYSIITIIYSLYNINNGLLINMITLDGIFSAIDFMKSYVITKNNDQQVNSDLYNYGIIDRYLLYFLISSIYKLICTFFWTDEIIPLYISLAIIIIPSSLNKILNHKYAHVIYDIKNTISKYFLAKIFTIVIKFYSNLYLNRDTPIKAKELMHFFDNSSIIWNYFTDVLKKLLIMHLLTYLKNYHKNIYYTTVKYIYNYQTNNTLVSFNLPKAKKYLVDIIENKNWKELENPNTYKAILCIHQLDNNSSSFIGVFTYKFNLLLAKMFSVWSIGTLFNNIYIIPLLSFLMGTYELLYNTNTNKTNKIIKFSYILINLLGSIIGYYTDSYFLTSLICQFMEPLLFNNIASIIFKFIKKHVIKLLNKIKEIDFFSVLDYLFYALYVNNLNHIDFDNIPLLLTIPFLFNTDNNNIFKSVSFCILVLTGYLSNHNLLHLIFNSMLLYILFDAIKIQNHIYNNIPVLNINIFNIFNRKNKNNNNIDNNIEDNIEDKLFELPTDEFIDKISVNPVNPVNEINQDNSIKIKTKEVGIVIKDNYHML